MAKINPKLRRQIAHELAVENGKKSWAKRLEDPEKERFVREILPYLGVAARKAKREG